MNRAEPFSTMLKETALVREILPELVGIRKVIEKSEFRDVLTKQIDMWQAHFTKDFTQAPPEQKEQVLNLYIKSMQEILIDPSTFAPLGLYALLGSDGYCYDSLSLAVHASLAESLKESLRSPMDPQNLARFWTVPHTVARHMAQWLQKHDALLYSEEVEQAYLQLLPEEAPVDKEERIARNIFHQIERDQQEAALREQGLQDLEKQIQEKLGLLVIKGTEEKNRVESRIHEMGAPFQAVEIQLRNAQEEEERWANDLKARIEKKIHSALEPLAQRIDTFAHNTSEKIQNIDKKTQETMCQLKQEIQKLEQEIAQLQKGNEVLKEEQAKVSQQLSQVQQEEKTLQQRIAETQIAVREMKKNSANQLLKTVALAGCSVFASWAVGAMVNSSSFGMHAAATSKGAKLGFALKF